MTDKVQKIISNLKDVIDDLGVTSPHRLPIIEAIECLQEEPVSEELEEAALLHLSKHYDTSIIWDEDEKCVVRDFKAGAKWQAEQFEKNRLAACDRQTEEEAEIERDFVTSIIEKEHRQPTFDDAIKYGMRLQKEQMMKDATECEVKIDAGGYPYIDRCIELYDYDKDIPLAKEGDKVKVIVIKEE